MLLQLLVITLFCFFVWLYLKWMFVKRYWEVRGVPYLPPSPIFGSLTFLQRENPSIWMRRIYNQFNKAPYCGMWLFWRPALVINSPELARNILAKDSANFRNRFMSSGASDPTGSLSILLLKDPAWSDIRRRLSGAFSSAKLKNVHMIAQTKSLDLIQRINRERNNRMNLRLLLSDYTTDVFGVASLGVVSDATLTGNSPIRTITRSFMEFTLFRGLSWCSIFFWPELVDIFRFSLLPKTSIDYFKKVLKIIISQRKDESMKDPQNILEYILQLQRTFAEEDEVYSEEVIVAQASIFLLGGVDTSAATLSYIIYHLAFNPEVQDKLYKELEQAKAENGGKLDTLVSELKYLDCIMKEVLRIFPPMSWLDRVALADYKVDDNLTIKAGTPVYVNAVGTQVDPEYFPDPYKFDPDRFLPENASKIKPYTYMPFGEGPRSCMGKRFAFLAMRCALSSIVSKYRLEPYPDSPHPMDIEVEKRGLFLFPGEVLSVQFIPRP